MPKWTPTPLEEADAGFLWRQPQYHWTRQTTRVAAYLEERQTAQRYGPVWASHAELSQTLGISIATIKRALRALASKGVLTIYRKQSPTRGPWRNRYILKKSNTKLASSPRRDILRQDVLPALHSYLRKRQARSPHEPLRVSAEQIARELDITPYYVRRALDLLLEQYIISRKGAHLHYRYIVWDSYRGPR